MVPLPNSPLLTNPDARPQLVIDAPARLIAQEAAADLKQSIVVESRRRIRYRGANAVAPAEPDGQTLVRGTNQAHA